MGIMKGTMGEYSIPLSFRSTGMDVSLLVRRDLEKYKFNALKTSRPEVMK
jgi:hypothetical protein